MATKNEEPEFGRIKSEILQKRGFEIEEFDSWPTRSELRDWLKGEDNTTITPA
jgi:hypothetical protein